MRTETSVDMGSPEFGLAALVHAVGLQLDGSKRKAQGIDGTETSSAQVAHELQTLMACCAKAYIDEGLNGDEVLAALDFISSAVPEASGASQRAEGTG